MIQTLGSVASIIGLAVSVYILVRERIIEKDVVDLKHEEEAWHEKEIRQEVRSN